MKPMASLPLASWTVFSFAAAACAASSHDTGNRLSPLRTIGWRMRSACLVKSNPNRPFTHRKSLLIPLRSRLFERRISWLRTLSVVLQPFEQCVHTVETYAISHGRVLYRYVPLVSAPTGQISMHIPHSSHSR